MRAMKWSDTLSVKIRRFDNEHKQLIALINDLYDTMSYDEENKVPVKMLYALFEYTINHFEHEEDTMKKHGFPGLAAHRAAHQAFMDKVADMQSNYERGSITLMGDIALTLPMFNFVTSWIQNHITTVDADYSEFLIKAGIK